ncbi:putative phage terminase, small subunit [Roseobacter litoralis Och 149]|uniref:Phage terminase, small subunit n=1 Tax=Roseobacter litoralis (strain ATCC 49566 / DSM 6996 / JCM 21268 / NBRC 15278 / OCh 149) TaxID=391595 RepID=F7ZA42_ROSLO|nr:putative phage terminase, small subunit [Roseobacter litoralis Och 149]
MIRGPKPRARAGDLADMPVAPDALPRCPGHLTDVARKEWRRLATPLHVMGVLSTTDRAALAAYCQA